MPVPSWPNPSFIGDKPTPLHEAIERRRRLLKGKRANIGTEPVSAVGLWPLHCGRKARGARSSRDCGSVSTSVSSLTKSAITCCPCRIGNTGLAISYSQLKMCSEGLACLKVILNVPVIDTSPMPDHPKLVDGLMDIEDPRQLAGRCSDHKDGLAVMREIMENYPTAG